MLTCRLGSPVFQDGRKMGYGSMQGIPMVASSPVRHDSPLGMNQIEVQSFQPPWKALSEFALHSDLDRVDTNQPHFQQLVNQVYLHNIIDFKVAQHRVAYMCMYITSYTITKND